MKNDDNSPKTVTKPRIDRPILVEGKYDKITLTSLFDATVLVTGGFSVFNNKEKQALLRRVAGEHGLLVLTDSDGGGKQIRSFLSGILPRERITMLYVPKVEGKERRKRAPSKSGLLGVEGMRPEVLFKIFSPYFTDAEHAPDDGQRITKLDLFRDGLSGSDGSAERRSILARSLSLPDDMSANALLEALNLLVTYEQYQSTVASLFSK